MAEFDKELLKEVTTGHKAFFIAYPWLLGLLWFAAGVRGFFFMLHCTGSALELFAHSTGADIAITSVFLALPVALWIFKEYFCKKGLDSGHTIGQIWAAWTYNDQHPAAPEGDDRWGKNNAERWVMTGGLIFVVLVIAFSIYGLA